jgi:hypothetical protein
MYILPLILKSEKLLNLCSQIKEPHFLLIKKAPQKLDQITSILSDFPECLPNIT